MEEDKSILNEAQGKCNPEVGGTKVKTPAEMLAGRIKSPHSDQPHVSSCGLSGRSSYSLPAARGLSFCS